jgi:hypothetical protein
MNLPAQKRQSGHRFWLIVSGICLVAVCLGVWQFSRANDAAKRLGSSPRQQTKAAASQALPKNITKTADLQLNQPSGAGTMAAEVSPVQRQPLLFRSKPAAPAAVLETLLSGPATVDQRVAKLQGLRGISLSAAERAGALRFLAGRVAHGDG